MVFFYLAMYVAAVLVILAAFFHSGPRLRMAAVALGAVAIWLPFTMLHTSLGRPNPFTTVGRYEILGSQLNVESERLYLLLDEFDANTPPRLFSVPFAPGDDPLKLEADISRNPYAYVGQAIDMGAGGEVTRVDQLPEPADWDKEEYYKHFAPLREAAK